MILLKTAAHLAAYFSSKKISQKNIGFVPTMGALHAGHRSLLQDAVANNPVTVCSIFVNPTQFNDPADFQKYPITIEKDIEMIESVGTGILFMPAVHEIYPNGIHTLPSFNLGRLEEIFEGKFRPGHFQGVCQVMSRLLSIVKPGNLYMGQKDYQQCLVISRLIEIMHEGVTMHTCPTVREPDGLAMSSRNVRLSPEARKKAVTISQVLQEIKQGIADTDLQTLINNGHTRLQHEGFRIDYLAAANAATLEPVDRQHDNTAIVALIAAFIDDVRLIDNMVITPSSV